MATRRRRLNTGSVGARVAVFTAFQLERLRCQQPAYPSVAIFDGIEVRRYGPRVVAETLVEGRARGATSEGLRRLAGYIFAANEGGASIPTTTPVATCSDGTRIAMTTPVTTRADAER